MKFEEVLPLLREGKYVKRKSWKDAKFAHRDCAFVTFDKDILDGDDWELYDPRTYMNFLEAVKVAKETGKKLIRKSWYGGCYLKIMADNFVLVYPGPSQDVHHTINFSYQDIIDDWYVE
jgi:hypothetical protein